MAVKLVTDSTWDLSRELAERWDITVVPCNVHFDDDVYKDGIDIGPDEFYARLASSPRLPTTAQPSVNDFLQVYKGLADQGNDVISIHLSAKLSGTLNSALQAKNALESPEGAGATRIEIIDSQLTSTGLGLVTLAAAQMALAGGSYEEVASKIQDSLPLTHCYFLVDTLEYLQRGGRIGKSQRLPRLPPEHQAHTDVEGRRSTPGRAGQDPGASPPQASRDRAWARSCGICVSRPQHHTG